MDDSYGYLLPDSALRNLKITDEDIIDYPNGIKRRKIYENVQYQPEEKQKIQGFRSYAQGKYDLNDVKDKTILRYLYSLNFDHQQTLQKIQIYNEWFSNPLIQRIDNITLDLINSGVCYTYGRDKNLRPIIYLNVTLIDMAKYTLEDYLSAINAVINLVIQKLYIKGKLQNYLFVIDTGNRNFSSLPLGTVKQMVLKLSYVYSMRMGKLLVINCNYLINWLYSAIAPFLADITREKTNLISYSDVQNGKMKEYIDINELEQRYGGFRQNLVKKWPPQIPGKQPNVKEKILQQIYFDDKNMTEYYSCENNQQWFQRQGQNMVTTQGGCCATSQCNIY